MSVSCLCVQISVNYDSEKERFGLYCLCKQDKSETIITNTPAHTFNVPLESKLNL